jgi:predicted transcriptional regulator
MAKINDLKNEYIQLLHAMQSGVASMMVFEDDVATKPKHLRVGVNSALVDTSSIVELLIKKGVFTEEEWYEKLVEMTKKEVKQYESLLSKKHGKVITLG